TVRLERRGETDLDVPSVPHEGFDAKVVVRDVAGNETVKEFPVDPVPDALVVTNSSVSTSMIVNGDEGWRDGSKAIVVFRTHPIGEGLRLWYEDVRGADGSSVERKRHPLDIVPFRESDEGKTKVYAIPPGTFR